MVSGYNIKALARLKQVVPVLIMCFCLVFLTGINFFFFPANHDSAAYELTKDGSKVPQVPAEEKSSESKGLTSIQEEYLHDHHTENILSFNSLTLHKVHQAEHLPFVIADQVYSPPKSTL